MSSEYGTEKDRALDRLLGLSDGVFAFAITLLVLDLLIPSDQTSHTNAALAGQLALEARQFEEYLLSYFFVGFWWVNHHRIFRHVRRYRERLLWLNLLFLLPVTLTPYFTKLTQSFYDVQLAGVLSSLDQLAAATMCAVLWRYISRNHRLVDKNLSDSYIRVIGWPSTFLAVAVLGAMAISAVSMLLVGLYWLVALPCLIVLFHRTMARIEPQVQSRA